jgi:hypothetical protein
MNGSSRSGRVLIKASAKKTVIVAMPGSHMALYRFINSGKEGDTVKILEKGVAAELHKLEWRDSIDVFVKNKDIEIEAGAKDAEIVVDMLQFV